MAQAVKLHVAGGPVVVVPGAGCSAMQHSPSKSVCTYARRRRIRMMARGIDAIPRDDGIASVSYPLLASVSVRASQRLGVVLYPFNGRSASARGDRKEHSLGLTDMIHYS
jgi:hypothetical protein